MLLPACCTRTHFRSEPEVGWKAHYFHLQTNLIISRPIIVRRISLCFVQTPDKRAQERKALTKSGVLQGINMSIALIVPTIATVATFSVHIAIGETLTSAQVRLYQGQIQGGAGHEVAPGGGGGARPLHLPPGSANICIILTSNSRS